MESDNPYSVRRLRKLVDSRAQAEAGAPTAQPQPNVATENWESQLKSEQVKRIIAENENYRQDTALRFKWANALLGLLWSVFGLMAGITLAVIGVPNYVRHNVNLLEWVIGGSCADMIGLGYIVAHYLFGNGGGASGTRRKRSLKVRY